jgi:hypothetical protein
MGQEVVADMQLRESGFALNAETGLQPLILGYRVKEVPISWINRFPGMGASSFRLVGRAGGGCWRVLLGVWLKQTCDAGPYGGSAPGHLRVQNGVQKPALIRPAGLADWSSLSAQE